MMSVHKIINEYGDVGKESIKQELRQIFVDKKVLVPIKKLPDGEKTIPSHLFGKAMHDANGNFDNFFGGGDVAKTQQQYDIKEISSPSPPIETVHSMLAVSTSGDEIMGSTDIPRAYLNAGVDRKHYIKSPKK